MSSAGGIPGTSQASPRPATSPDTTVGKVADVLDRRNESRRYMQINVWDSWEDVYRASKCRTKPILVKDKAGNEVEDKTRTNVAMPELSLIARRKTARLTANPPQINYTVPDGGDTDLGERLTAWAYQQFDRSGEAMEHRRMVQSGTLFGWGTSKLYWDTVEVTKMFFRQFNRDSQFPVSRTGLMQLQGAPEDEIAGAVKEQGDELNDSDIAQGIAKYGSSVQMQTKVKQFEGPVSKNVFIGDFFMEPGAASLNLSGWAIENYWESDVWLEKMAAKVYLDPQDGKTEIPVCSPKAIQELADMPSWQPIYQQQPFDLRSRLRTNALGQTLPLWPTKLLKGKRYDILECHTKDKDGQFWIEWIGNEKVYLGRMPYPWDLYGKYCYTEFCPLFDMLSAYGDSTPLLLRHLWLLHNAIVGSRRDIVANLLRPLMKLRTGADVPDEQVDRALFRIIQMRNPEDLQPLMEPVNLMPGVAAANEEEAQNMRMMALAEPNLTNVETGTDSNPQAGRTATTAVLAAKSADALTQFEIDSLNWYLKESGEKKLAMLQQTEPETDQQGQYQPYEISGKFTAKVEGLTQRYGKASMAKLDFMELQQEIQVEPAAMSMLSVDDEIRRTGALQLVEMAGQMPNIVDPYYAAHFFATTIRGIDADKAVPPPKPPVPPPPKVSVAVAVKYPELPPEAQTAIVESMGAQVTPATQQDMQISHTLKGIEKASEAADHADNLMSSKSVDDEPTTPMAKKVNNAAPSK
jgi:hypothetical protein